MHFLGDLLDAPIVFRDSAYPRRHRLRAKDNRGQQIVGW